MSTGSCKFCHKQAATKNRVTLCINHVREYASSCKAYHLTRKDSRGNNLYNNKLLDHAKAISFPLDEIIIRVALKNHSYKYLGGEETRMRIDHCIKYFDGKLDDGHLQLDRV